MFQRHLNLMRQFLYFEVVLIVWLSHNVYVVRTQLCVLFGKSLLNYGIIEVFEANVQGSSILRQVEKKDRHSTKERSFY